MRDREIVALVASALAYGRVEQILRSVARVLDRMDSPSRFVMEEPEGSLRHAFDDFKHRFTTGAELASMLLGVRRALERRGSLEACLAHSIAPNPDTVLPALEGFVDELTVGWSGRNSLLPSPRAGSACKRLNLFLRWMVRKDRVDPGGWDSVPRSSLIIPLDTHMHRIGRALRFTARKQADMRTALEVTAAFRRMVPDDPVRYDFSLTRLGIRKDGDLDAFLKDCGPG